AEALRSLSENRPPGSNRLHFFGFDIDVLAGGGYEDLAGLINQYRDAPEVRSLQTLLERVPGETIDQEIDRLTRAVQIIGHQSDQLAKRLGKEHYQQIKQWSLTLLDSFKFIRTANPANDWATLNRAMAAREEVMAHHVMHVWSQMAPEEKLVLMGHNRHLSKDAGSIHTKGASPGSRQWHSMGTLIHRLLPDQVFSIWMLHDQGLSSQPYNWLSSEYTSIPGSLNSILAEVGPAFILPTSSDDPRAGLLATKMNIAGLYNQVYRTAIARQADAIFFVRKVSPLRP
ncbi:MAG TPA: erythromycin esterase family protein, partial [Firmicutes bacterium]|nr:erythromycin esterase family protein [Bacillota bacterium]